MVNRKNELKFIVENERNILDVGLGKIDLMSDNDLDDIFISDRRDGVRSRFKDKLRLF